jgi:hypothetical protein
MLNGRNSDIVVIVVTDLKILKLSSHSSPPDTSIVFIYIVTSRNGKNFSNSSLSLTHFVYSSFLAE